MGRRSALLVGTYDYKDSSLQRLAAPGHDVEALANVLADPQIAGFEVTTLINRPHHIVGEAIGNFYDRLRRDDLALLYFSGHGLKDDQGRLFLAMTNSRREQLRFTAIGADQVNDAMSSCPSRQKVLILDCCYGGAFPVGWTAKSASDVHALQPFRGRGRVVLTASDAAQYSFEGDNLSGTGARSLFTRYLVEGIRTGDADLDQDGDVSLDELYSYVFDRVVKAMPQQRPKKQEDVEGKIVIAQNVGWTLPAHILNAIRSSIPADRQGAVQALSDLYLVGNTTIRRRVIEQVSRLMNDTSHNVSAAATELMKTAYREAINNGHPALNPEAAFTLGRLLMEEGDVSGAKTAYQHAIKSGHKEWAPRAGCVLGFLLLEEGDVSGAKTAYQHAIKSGHMEWAPGASFQLGQLLADQGDFAGAKVAYQQAINTGHKEWAPIAVENLNELQSSSGDQARAKGASQPTPNRRTLKADRLLGLFTGRKH